MASSLASPGGDASLEEVGRGEERNDEPASLPALGAGAAGELPHATNSPNAAQQHKKSRAAVRLCFPVTDGSIALRRPVRDQAHLPINFAFEGQAGGSGEADDDRILVELKTVERLLPIHEALGRDVPAPRPLGGRPAGQLQRHRPQDRAAAPDARAPGFLPTLRPSCSNQIDGPGACQGISQARPMILDTFLRVPCTE